MHLTGHPFPLDTVVIAKQSRHSKSWDEARVASFKTTRGYTLYSLTWKDDSDGSWSRNVPQSRVKTKPPSNTSAPLPDQHTSHISRPAPKTNPPHPFSPSTSVFAKQARFSRTWDKATVLSHRVSRGLIQYDLRWEVDGYLSDHVPMSLVRAQTSPPPTTTTAPATLPHPSH